MSAGASRPSGAPLPDATALLERLRGGEITAHELMREHLARLDAEQPRLNAATQVLRERALAEAESPRPGPLSGLPVSVKEFIALAGEQMTLGSRRMPPIDCEDDAVVVQRLRDAGAIVIARSNVPELGLAGETDNLRYGRTNNPLFEERTCGGSSGGEGALVASGCSAFGVGSDLLGSIRIPASFCGLVGFKPASDAIDKTDTWPAFDNHLDSWLALGPLTRSVRDARLVYDVIAERPLALPPPLKALRLVVPEPFPLKIREACIGSALARAQAGLESAGLSVERRNFSDIAHLYRNIAPLLAGLLDEELLELLTDDDGVEFSLLRETLQRWRGAPTVYDGVYRLLWLLPLARPRRKHRLEHLVDETLAARAKYRNLLGEDGIVILPSLGMLAPRHGDMNRETLRVGTNRRMTSMTMCNYLDLPAISIPAWSDRDPDTGLVPGIMLACRPGAEAALLAAATAVETALRGTGAPAGDANRQAAG